MADWIRSRIQRPAWEATAFFLLALIAGFLIQFATPNLPDGDAFYHMGHAAAYVENGPFLSSFTWLTLSEIGRLGGDLWYGFHILLAPFVVLGDPVAGMRAAGAVMLAIMLLGIHLALRGADWRLRWLIPIVVLASSASELMRWIALRPQLPSLGFAALLLWILCTQRRPLWQVALLAAAIAWMHLAFFWLPFAVVVAAGLAKALALRRADEGVFPFWQAGLAVIGGILAGAMLRPVPLATLNLLKIQLFDLGEALRNEVPLGYGEELEPISSDLLRDEYAIFLAIWLLALAATLVLAWRRRLPDDPVHRRLVIGSFLMSLAGYMLAVRLTSRGLDIWVVFGAIFAAYAFSPLLGMAGSSRVNKLVTAGAAMLAFVAWSSYSGAQLALRYVGLPPRQFEKAMAWLLANSPRGSVIATPSWSSFGPMFIWSRHNRHLAGMDPIFQYVRDPRRYWIANALAVAEGSRTINVALTGEPAVWKDTAAAIKEDLAAAWLVVVAENTPKLFRLCESDPRFRRVFVDGTVVIYAL